MIPRDVKIIIFSVREFMKDSFHLANKATGTSNHVKSRAETARVTNAVSSVDGVNFRTKFFPI